MLDENNGDIMISILAGSLLLFLLCTFIFAFSLLYLRKRRFHSIEKQKLASEYESALLQTQLEIKEQLMQDMSHEVHDNLGQVASLIKIYLNTLQYNNANKTRQKVEETKDLVRQLISDLKQLSLRLNSNRVVQLGLLEGLKTEVTRLNKIGYYNVEFEHDESNPITEANTTIILYRMVQEIINNIVKHSGAKRINIELRVLNNLLILVFNDDGKGFNFEEDLNSNGSGLMNLKYRAKLISAKLQIESSIGNGTNITIKAPI